MSSLVDLQALLQEVKGLIALDKPLPSTLRQPQIAFTGFQAPIKGSYFNSGNYSPTIATDKRHPTGHQGVDLRAPGGTALYPIAEGTVLGVGSSGKGGMWVNIQHPKNVRAYYAHLGVVSVRQGQQVTKATQIGTVGDSGNARGTFPHLHIQVWQNGQLQNPGMFFPVPPYTKPSSEEKVWLSDEAKQQARQFSLPQKIAYINHLLNNYT